MNDKRINIFLNYICGVLFGLGAILMASPILINWWINGDYDRYLWIINGPYPYSSFGGGPFQLFLYGGLFLAGILFIAVAFGLKTLVSKKRNKKISAYK